MRIHSRGTADKCIQCVTTFDSILRRHCIANSAKPGIDEANNRN